MVKKNIVTIFDKLAVRDDSLHYPDDLCWIETEGVKRVGFAIDNRTDAAFTAQPIGSIGSVKADLGNAVSVNANSSKMVPLNLDNYFALAVSVSIQASSSPTEGRVTVFGVWQDG